MFSTKMSITSWEILHPANLLIYNYTLYNMMATRLSTLPHLKKWCLNRAQKQIQYMSKHAKQWNIKSSHELSHIFWRVFRLRKCQNSTLPLVFVRCYVKVGLHTFSSSEYTCGWLRHSRRVQPDPRKSSPVLNVHEYWSERVRLHRHA